MSQPPRPLSMRETLSYLITVLTRMARKRSWGVVQITVQAGQIFVVQETTTYRDRLPDVAGDQEVQQHLDTPDIKRRLASV